ncbi:GlxA family transcriptional regulator [Thalassospira lucentensis]|uniref:GlxA family transcriptional regulator n=1 Tax=Thalassospira lucentensis TaxID=168935 RepID=UPI00041B9599|nr:GlxA family transcriptional regulator [Thalassospira lucentensis]
MPEIDPTKSQHFVFVLFDGFSNMVLASALEPLRAASRLPNGPDINWTICTIDGAPVQSSSGLVITPQAGLSSGKPGEKIDYLVVISGYEMRDHLNARTRARLINVAQHAGHVIGLDTAAWILAACNMLDEKSATIHWQELDQFAEQFPDVIVRQDRFVQDGKFITSGGASTVMELMLHILSGQFGPAVAFDVSNLFVYDAENQYEKTRGADRLRGPGAAFLRRAVSDMLANIETPVSLDAIAANVGCSLRSLDRIFHQNLHMAPGKYYQMLRLGRARDLAQSTDFPLTSIALQTGFKSSSTLSRAFSQSFGTTIRSVRAMRGNRSFATVNPDEETKG